MIADPPISTDPDTEERDRRVAELINRGYLIVTEHDGIRAGARVRNRGEQYTKAYLHGTAVVLAVLERPNSPWSVSWHRPDVEVVIKRDAHLRPDMSPLSTWADYGTCLVEAQP